MLDNSYEIVGRIVVNDAAQSGAASVQKRLVDIENRAAATGASISSALARGFAVLGGTALVGGAVRGLIGLNSEIETARSGLAGLYTAQTGMPIAESLRVARTELGLLRQDAARGVGELSNYLETYQGIVGVALPLGASTDQMRELTRNALAAGFAMQGDRGLINAPLDVQQAMTGQVGDRTTPIVMAALRASGMSVETFRALRPEERIDALNKAFGTFGPAVALMGKSWSAQSSTLMDNLKEIVRTVTAPLFDRWTGALRRANEWIDGHRDVLVDIADRWGAKILQVWDHVIDNARTYLGLLVAAAAVQAAPTVIGAARGAGGALASAGGAVAAGFRGVSLSDPAGMSAVFAGLTGGAGASSGGVAGLGASLARLAGPVALVATAATAAYGAIVEFPGLLVFLSDSGRYVVESFAGLASALGRLTSEGSALNYVGAALVGTFGGLGYVLGGAVRLVGTFAIGLGVMFQVLGEGMRILYDLASGNGSALVNGTDRMAAALVSAQDEIGKLWFGEGNAGIQGEQTGPGGQLKSPVKKGGDNITNINGPVTLQMKTEMNADPARVISAFEEGADRLTRFKRSGSGSFGEV